MDIQNSITKPSESNQLRNLNTIRIESKNITTEQGKIELTIGNLKSTLLLLTLVWTLLPITFIFKSRKEVSFLKYMLCSTKVLLGIFQNMFLKFRVINGEYIINLSRGKV